METPGLRVMLSSLKSQDPDEAVVHILNGARVILSLARGGSETFACLAASWPLHVPLKMLKKQHLCTSARILHLLA
jgi:hypothetical protein